MIESTPASVTEAFAGALLGFSVDRCNAGEAVVRAKTDIKVTAATRRNP
jgi:hypothetical protein